MAVTDEARRAMIMERHAMTLHCVSQWDEEIMLTLPEHRPLEVFASQRRSWPQLQMYFARLGKLIQATDCAPTVATLHKQMKYEQGLIVPWQDWRGELRWSVDSVALAKMSQDDFNHYLERCWQLIAERFAIDVEKDLGP